MALIVALKETLASATDEETRHMYTIRPPKVNRERRAVEIIDLGSFLLTNSEEGRPKPMAPFYLNIFETREDLSEGAIQNVEDATSEFLLQELNTVFDWNYVADVSTRINKQERFVKQINDRRLGEKNNGILRGRQLRNVPGSKLEVDVNVTFNREPSPDISVVDDSLQFIMKDLVYLVHNITAAEDPELGYVFMAYREEISEKSESPNTVDSIQVPVVEKQDSDAMSIIIPVLIAFVLLGALIALFVIRRRRRRVQAANQKVQEDLAFLDEETNVFSFENSPTKSSAKKRAYEVNAGNLEGDNDSFSRYSASQGSLSQTSPNSGMMSSFQGSPTARSNLRSNLSGAETVKVSNARQMPLPSKLTELASNSLFAFSEEDEDYEASSEAGNSQRTPTSVQRSEASNGSSAFNRIMNGKSDEEGISSVNTSPRHAVASPTGSASDNSAGAGNKSTFSFFSSTFFSAFGDNVSHFGGSTLTVQAANTTEAVRKKALKQNVRSFSLSPQHKKETSNLSPRATKSEHGGDDESTDTSLFDFVAQDNTSKKDADLTDVPLTPLTNESTGKPSSPIVAKAPTPQGSPKASPTQTTTASPTTDASASPKQEDNKVETSVAADPEAVAGVATPGTMKSTSTQLAASGERDNKTGVNSALEALRNLKKVVMNPQTPAQAQPIAYNLKSRPQEQGYNDLMNEEDSLFEDDAPGSFPRRSRRHAKSTTHDGTFAYQTNAMQPQEWSMTDGYSDDDTLSEQGGGAAFGAFPQAGFRSPDSPQKRADQSKSPSNQSRSSVSQATQNSPGSKAESSQASASRQLISDLVWLSKKIAGVKQSAIDSAPGETSALVGAPLQIEPVDSLSYASQDGLISPTSARSNSKQKRTPGQSTPTNAGAATNTSIVCRDCHAPAGKLNIVIHSTKDGPAVHEVKSGSCLEGRIYPGDLIIAVDDVDTRAYTAAQLMKMMAERSQSERKITVLHFEETSTTPSSLKDA
jgi:hypothetical protein